LPKGRGRLRRIGRVLHVTRAGDLVLRSNSGFVPKIGDRAYGPDLRLVGFIADVFGPVSSPYVMVRPLVDEPDELVGQVLYVGRGKGRRWRG